MHSKNDAGAEGITHLHFADDFPPLDTTRLSWCDKYRLIAVLSRRSWPDDWDLSFHFRLLYGYKSPK